MNQRILVVEPDKSTAQELAVYFIKRGDKVVRASNAVHACQYIKKITPALVFISLHLPGDEFLKVIGCIRQEYPDIGIIITSKQPDIHRELLAKQRGINVFLRYPFKAEWIEYALQDIGLSNQGIPTRISVRDTIPRVRVPMRLKITFPYAILALLFALVSSLLISKFIFESMYDRFLSQLIDTGKLTSDWMVQEEARILETVRLLANTRGIAEAIVNQDVDRLWEIAIPVAINYQEESLSFLDLQGRSILSIRTDSGKGNFEYQTYRGENDFVGQGFIERVLEQQPDQQGDKFAGFAQYPWGNYLFIAGPVYDEGRNLVGAIVVGKSLPTLVDQIRQDTLAQISIYMPEGDLVESTFLNPDEIDHLPSNLVHSIFRNQDFESSIREFSIGSSKYSEILAPWEVRGGYDVGVIGTAIAQNFVTRPSFVTRFQLWAVVVLAVVGVVVLGLFLAGQITHPLKHIMQAATEVAHGNFEVKVPSGGNDEVMVLAHAFNSMVSGLQEGVIYRDLLGRTVSPEIRERLRHSFSSGEIRLEGQNTTATVLITDIRGFTAISEREEPTTVLNWLNEYFAAIVPVIISHGGVVDKFEGDSLLAFFGILPTPLPPEESAYQACKASLELLEVIESMNRRREQRGEPPMITGIGINTGTLTAGSLGTSDRLSYTVIGDTVNATQRIEGVTRDFGESGIALSETTLAALKNYRDKFNLVPLGEKALKGKQELLWLYRLYPKTRRHTSQVKKSKPS